MAKKNLKPVFKAYSQHQVMLLPPSLDELIKDNHPVRVVSDVIDKIDLDPLLKKFSGGGAGSYHPRMLLKVLVYAYIDNNYSSRRIEQALQANIHYMWISGMQQPDHNTINRFRSERLKDVLRQIFTQVVLLLAQEGVLSIKELYVDGTKIEANAGRYTFVWGNAIKTNKEKIKKQLDELWKYAQNIAASELPDNDPTRFDKIDADKVRQAVEQIDQALKDKPGVSAKVKQKLNYAARNWPSNLSKYDGQEKILESRNSYSKTDIDATFMRMKEDHMLNGQLKPAYNLQLSTNHQYIVDYSLHPNPTDTLTLPAHIAQHNNTFNELPDCITADAGYGSEQNYELMEKEGVEAFIKYNTFDREQDRSKNNKHPFSAGKLYYNSQKDCYICPMGQTMHKIGTYEQTTAGGFRQSLTKYSATNCEGCPLRGVCHKAKGNRIIEVNHNLIRHKQIANEKLTSERGIYYRKKRPIDVEPVFASIKHNHGFRRFMLRGKEKVLIEAGLVALAHNLRKKAA
ncbi:MAG: IS1182 family transposase [Chitinophagaceae bacterium]